MITKAGVLRVGPAGSVFINHVLYKPGVLLPELPDKVVKPLWDEGLLVVADERGEATLRKQSLQTNGPVKQDGKWNLDPAGLKGKSLDALNAMVLERDKAIKPFETPEEAIAHLSQDFKPGK